MIIIHINYINILNVILNNNNKYYYSVKKVVKFVWFLKYHIIRNNTKCVYQLFYYMTD